MVQKIKNSKHSEKFKARVHKSPHASLNLSSLNAWVDHILQVNSEKIKKNQEAYRLTPEAIHDMRVATRRLRAAIKTFRKILPTEARKIRTELRKLGRLLGKKRDLDVFFGFVLQIIKPAPLALVQQMEQSQNKLLSKLHSEWYNSLLEKLGQLKASPSQKNASKGLKKRAQKALKRVLDIAPSIDSKCGDKTLHRLRISVKKLRYILEFCEPIFNLYIHPLGAFIDLTKEMQDILGEHQDAITGKALLMRYEGFFSSEEFHQVKKEYELKKSKTKKSFFKKWKNYLSELEKVDGEWTNEN